MWESSRFECDEFLDIRCTERVNVAVTTRSSTQQSVISRSPLVLVYQTIRTLAFARNGAVIRRHHVLHAVEHTRTNTPTHHKEKKKKSENLISNVFATAIFIQSRSRYGVTGSSSSSYLVNTAYLRNKIQQSLASLRSCPSARLPP